MAITMTESMYKELDKFFAEKTVHDVDRDSYLVCNLRDNRFKINISLIFMRNWHSIESDSYNSVILDNKGVVFTFPCYWVSVPKELSIAYFEYIINEFYSSEVSDWECVSGYSNSTAGEDNNSPSNGNCNCHHQDQSKIPTMPPCQNNFV